MALAAIEKGVRAVKVKVGLDRARDIARVAAVRSAVGDDFRVGVDANCGWNETDTLWDSAFGASECKRDRAADGKARFPIVRTIADADAHTYHA